MTRIWSVRIVASGNPWSLFTPHGHRRELIVYEMGVKAIRIIYKHVNSEPKAENLVKDRISA